MAVDGHPGTAVTARDLATGESETNEIRDDYVIVTDGRCYVSGTTVYANGTHVITVKKERAG